MQNIPYTEFVKDIVSKRGLYNKEGKDLLQTLAKKLANSVYICSIRRDVKDQFICVTDKWMKVNYGDRVTEWWPLKNANTKVKLEDDKGVDEYDIANSSNQMPCHLGSYTLGHSKRKMNNFIREIDGFYSNNIYYGDTDSADIHKKTLVHVG